MFGQKKDYKKIVAPLKKIESDLSVYIGDQGNAIADLEVERKKIEDDITTSKLEIKRSEHTVVKIAELLGTDFDGDDEVEFVEPEPAPVEAVKDDKPKE